MASKVKKGGKPKPYTCLADLCLVTQKSGGLKWPKIVNNIKKDAGFEIAKKTTELRYNNKIKTLSIRTKAIKTKDKIRYITTIEREIDINAVNVDGHNFDIVYIYENGHGYTKTNDESDGNQNNAESKEIESSQVKSSSIKPHFLYNKENDKSHQNSVKKMRHLVTTKSATPNATHNNDDNDDYDDNESKKSEFGDNDVTMKNVSDQYNAVNHNIMTPRSTKTTAIAPKSVQRQSVQHQLPIVNQFQFGALGQNTIDLPETPQKINKKCKRKYPVISYPANMGYLEKCAYAERFIKKLESMPHEPEFFKPLKKSNYNAADDLKQFMSLFGYDNDDNDDNNDDDDDDDNDGDENNNNNNKL